MNIIIIKCHAIWYHHCASSTTVLLCEGSVCQTITSYCVMSSLGLFLKWDPQTTLIICLLMVLGKSCLVLEIWRWGFGVSTLQETKTIDNSLYSLFCLSDLMASVLLSCFEVRSRTPAASNDRKTMIVMASSSLMRSEGHVFKSLVLLPLSNPCCLPAARP